MEEGTEDSYEKPNSQKLWTGDSKWICNKSPGLLLYMVTSLILYQTIMKALSLKTQPPINVEMTFSMAVWVWATHVPKLLLLVAACCSFAILDAIFSL